MVTSQSSGQLWVEIYHAMGTRRARRIPKVNNNMTRRIHGMFKLGYIIDYFTCIDKVQILYPLSKEGCE